MLLRLSFAIGRNDPFPPVDSLPTIDVAEPLSVLNCRLAVRAYLETGRGPHDRAYQWARVVLNQHDNGNVWQFIAMPLEVAAVIPVDSVTPPAAI